MSLPGFLADASVYSHKQIYRRFSRPVASTSAASVVPAQGGNDTLCALGCTVSLASCLAGCAGSIFGVELCIPICLVAAGLCFSQCPGQNGGPGSTFACSDNTDCRKGKFCCECNGFCFADSPGGHAACAQVCKNKN